MKSEDEKTVSRRNWLGLITTASLGTGLMAWSPKVLGAGYPLRSSLPADKNTGIRTFNIYDFGAKGDGKTLDTKALQDAIDACHNDHGGTVIIPAGIFVIGTVELKSNVTLHISAQGVLLGTADGKQYYASDAIPLHGDSTLEDGNVGLLFAVNAENITIEGEGTIDGQGTQFVSPAQGVPPPAGISGPHRPYHLLFYQCKNLSIRNIYLKDSAFHSIRVIQSSYIKVDGIHIHSRVIHNNDGFHFISSQYVHVSKCDIQTQDDACALFGSCKFITISDSSFSTRWSVFRFGGGEAENITVSNCIIYQTYGCPIKIHCSPGSRFENFLFSNIIMNGVTGPIYIGLSDKKRNAEAKNGPGIVRNISFNNIQAKVVKPIQLPDTQYKSNPKPGEELSSIILNAYGKNHIENISFNNIKISFPGGGTHADAIREFPNIVGEYFQAGTTPAYALYARNVHGLTVHDVRIEVANQEMRPAIIFDHVNDAAVNGLNVAGDKSAEAVLRFVNSADVLLTAPRLLTVAGTFLKIVGKDSQNIKVDGGDLTKSSKRYSINQGADQKSLQWKV